jgi:hypothetical protein
MCFSNMCMFGNTWSAVLYLVGWNLTPSYIFIFRCSWCFSTSEITRFGSIHVCLSYLPARPHRGCPSELGNPQGYPKGKSEPWGWYSQGSYSGVSILAFAWVGLFLTMPLPPFGALPARHAPHSFVPMSLSLTGLWHPLASTILGSTTLGLATYRACTPWTHPQVSSPSLLPIALATPRALPHRSFPRLLAPWGLAPCACCSSDFSPQASSPVAPRLSKSIALLSLGLDTPGLLPSWVGPPQEPVPPGDTPRISLPSLLPTGLATLGLYYLGLFPACLFLGV